MTDKVFKLGVLKLGCIGAAPLLDLLLDERADREDLQVQAFTSGAKLEADACADPTRLVVDYRPDLILMVSPNAALPGPKNSRAQIAEAGIPVITVSDGPSKKAFYKKNDEGKQVINVPDGQGFFVLVSDPMIGARREFLDPSEMALFNADVIKVLAATGVLRFIQNELDRVIDELKSGAKPELPKVNLTAEKAVTAGEFDNPYAAAKALAALKVAESVAAVTSKGCFAEQDPAKYITLVAAGHEMMRAAARLADEARELEKSEDTLARTPHASAGGRLTKSRLADKPV
ncbi:MAG TPA: F420-dependent methylenetetrahydromethanopterin dehydrogenase [Gammaproteobacteria bacterium]|nr:F420-dependent methylenetetrahydromethanopterin dehydrogenase [Gammaproteobacteria bacterium]